MIICKEANKYPPLYKSLWKPHFRNAKSAFEARLDFYGGATITPG